jgi:hypothetical protein
LFGVYNEDAVAGLGLPSSEQGAQTPRAMGMVLLRANSQLGQLGCPCCLQGRKHYHIVCMLSIQQDIRALSYRRQWVAAGGAAAQL